MKISYEHIARSIVNKPSIKELSEKLFQLGHEHEINDNIFEIEFTPNRGDCLSLKGILRDLAVFYKIKKNETIYEKRIENFNIDFQNNCESVCPKISFLKIDIDSGPETYHGFLHDYFNTFNINTNNFFTDVSNYILYETGQPTHCYDASKITSPIIFSELNKDIEFETLLDKKIKLEGKNYVFTSGDEIINLAGVMGSKKTACSKYTKSVIVECAFFVPEAIIGKSVKYDIKSDAAYRFERGVDSECHDDVLKRFLQIVSDHADIKNIEMFTKDYVEKNNISIPLDVSKINKIIGTDITESDYINYLKKLNLLISNGNIEIPLYRRDIQSQNDLAEEIARSIGYDSLPRKKITIPVASEVENINIETKIKSLLLDNGFYEVINQPFVPKKTSKSIKVDNPLDSNREYLRTNLMDSLLDNLLLNERRQKDSVKFFEISDVYLTDNKGFKKERKLAVIASGRIGKNYKDFSRKINQDYLLSLFSLLLSKKELNISSLSRENLDTKFKSPIVGFEIEINELSMDILEYEEISSAPIDFIQYKPISELPSSFRDISYSIKDFTKIEELKNMIFNSTNEILKEVFIFDYFKNEKTNEIKIGFRFIFQGLNSTLTDVEVDRVLNAIIERTIELESVDIPGL